MGAVTLKVGNLDNMIDYYHRGVGLQVLSHDTASATLGRAGIPTLNLAYAPELKHAPANSAGLFHTAILFPEQSELAASVYSVARNFGQSFTGSSDHLVSKALYFDDPEGNGVELYWDRPRDEWTWRDGSVAMATEYLDPNAFLTEHLTPEGSEVVADTAASVGHVHLKVGDIATAEQFYVDTVGFEVTTRYGAQALFVAAGGYHHHLGMNTWQSKGAGDRTPALGLGEVSVALPGLDDVGALEQRLASRGVATRHDGQELLFNDPWQNTVRVRVSA
ncbi:VOC family protein [Lysinibacter cavernae]|nr:VOC family protein [Lysinibacter cavernae]